MTLDGNARELSVDLFKSNINLLENGLNYSIVKQNTIAQNIANADVPGYKRQNVSFKEMLNEINETAVQTNRTDNRHIPFQSKLGTQLLSKIINQQYGRDGNNVDIDKEMSELASNQIYYQALVDRLNGKFSTLQNVIRGGK